ncbi:MAG: protein kinase [Bacteroidales bacterium]|nr:protein kinase [Bacteroidales bacterium]
MQKQLVGKNYSYLFDFVLPEEEDQKDNDTGLVFRGICEQTNSTVVIRYLNDTKLVRNQQHLQVIQNILLCLNQTHQGIVKTYDCCIDDDGIYFIREQLIGIDLHSVIFSGDYPHLREPAFILRVGEKVCEILSTLHANKIVHRRIQPSTIFLVANELGQIDIDNPTVKILNFEYAQVNGQSILNFASIPYAMYYSAPEMVLQCGLLVNESCDIYSTGITLYEAFAREHAFVCDKDDKNLILNMQISFPLKKSHRTSKETFALLQKATVKHIFSTPPMRYKQDARLKFLYNAQVQRFKSAEEMRNAIQVLIENVQNQKSSLERFKEYFQKLINH